MKLSLSRPCPVSATLSPCGDGTSACDHCPLRVHHLSAMLNAEGQALVERGARERICVQYFQDADGNVLFGPTLRRMAAAGALFVALPAMADGHDALTPDQAHVLATEHNRARYALEQVGLSMGDDGRVVDPQQADVPAGDVEPEFIVQMDGGI